MENIAAQSSGEDTSLEVWSPDEERLESQGTGSVSGARFFFSGPVNCSGAVHTPIKTRIDTVQGQVPSPLVDGRN